LLLYGTVGCVGSAVNAQVLTDSTDVAAPACAASASGSGSGSPTYTNFRCGPLSTPSSLCFSCMCLFEFFCECLSCCHAFWHDPCVCVCINVSMCDGMTVRLYSLLNVGLFELTCVWECVCVFESVCDE
jgi:hypothetical protein